MRPTIRDVARLARCSIATVSLVLNNKDVSIPQSTIERIWKAANELNYRPNKLAVGMITKRTKMLGLVIPDNSNAFFGDLAKAIETAARKNDYNLILCDSDNNGQRDLEYISILSDRQVDGVIFVRSEGNQQDDRKIIQIADQNGIPLVTVDRTMHGEKVYSITLDNFRGGYLAAQHLISLGHKRIGCYSGPLELNSSHQRLDGVKEALAEAGIPYDESLLFVGEYKLGRENEALAYFLDKKVTAVFAFNDMMAFGLYVSAMQMNISIPQDLSVVGFDDIFFCKLVSPQLTTVRQPVSDMGVCVVETLIRIMNGNNDGQPAIRKFEPELIVRSSTAPPKKN
jgi:LacI family transcriptional regulator